MSDNPTSVEVAEGFGEKPVLRSEQIGLNPMRAFEHQFRLGDTVRIGDSVGVVNGFSGRRFVSLSCSNGWHNHESLTLVDTENRLYTLADAIDKIVDGLRMEWLRPHPNEGYVDAESFDGWYRATPDAAYFRRSQECAWTVIQESLGGESNKEACLADYKTRFRAEIERAVKHE